MSKALNKEFITGTITVAFVALLLGCVYSGGRVRSEAAGGSNYRLHARFGIVDGIFPGSKVRVAGVAAGEVKTININKDFSVDVEMRMNDDFGIPVDSSIQIVTDGLLGSKYIEIIPGGEDEVIPNGGTVSYAQGSILIDFIMEQVLSMIKERHDRCDAALKNSKAGVK